MPTIETIRVDLPILLPVVLTAFTYTVAIFGMIGAFFTQIFWVLVLSMALLSLSMAGVYRVFRRYRRGLAEKVVNYNDCEHGALISASECPNGPWYPACLSFDERVKCTKKCIAKDVWEEG